MKIKILKSKIIHKTMFLMSILIAGYIGAILIHAFPKINETVTNLKKANIKDMHNSIALISKMRYQDINDYKKEILVLKKKLIKNITLDNHIDIYISKKEKNLIDEIDKLLKHSSSGKLGTTFIFNNYGKIIMSQKDILKGIDLKNIKNKDTNQSLYNTFLKAKKFNGELKYKWNRANDKDNFNYEKIVWITYIPKLKWHIATTTYTKELEIMAHKLQRIVATLGLISLFVAIIISFIFFKRLLQPILTLSQMANSATKGDYSKRVKIKSNDEIGKLAQNFNTMIETIEKNIKKEKKIMEQSRLAQMGEIMSMIAHQWRQPLSTINSAIINIKIAIFSEKYNLDKKDDRDKFLLVVKNKLNMIEEYVEFLSTTIDDFRTFFKPDNNKELVQLIMPITKALQMIEPSLVMKNIKIIKNFTNNDRIFIYKNELIQVILNILKNSEDNFIEKNISNPIIILQTEKINNKLKISISDNGGGMPEEIIGKIFKPYFSTKLEKNGTGLGLHMSKVIIEEHHNGILKAKNVENGVTFEIILQQ